MNTRTTFYLAVVLVLLGSSYMLVKSRPPSDELETTPLPGLAASAATRDVFEEKLGDVVSVVCKRKNGEEWVFQKTKSDAATSPDEWHMTSPMAAKCVSWEVNRFGSRLGSLQYDISYRAGQPGAPTPKEAGLDPPEAIVTLTDDANKSVTIEIGASPSRRETYVRVSGRDDILLAKTSLKDLFKDSALAYREKRIWSFDTAKATRVEILDRSAGEEVAYVLAKDGSRWMMESPVTARATSKVDDMLRAISNLRVLKWQDDDPAKLALFGLDPGSVTVSVTVEEEIPVEQDSDADEATDSEAEAPEPVTETKVRSYELLVSDRSPIGEDTKTYLRVVGENAVATIMKSVADKLRPVMSEWRDMHVTAVNVSAAKRIELDTPDGTATLVNKDGEWSYQPDGGLAEGDVVSELLKAIGDLSAVVFIDTPTTDAPSYGLDTPQAEVRLTIPGVEGIETITVGAYSDRATKRLVYVRRNDGPSIAKVRAADISNIIRGPLTYRDRTIIAVLPSRFKRIALASRNADDDGETEITLERAGNDWTISRPVSAEVRTDAVDDLLAELGGLRAERVVGDESQVSAYGLHAPAATVTLTYKIVGEVSEDSEDSESGDTEAVEGTSRSIELAVTKHEGSYYAKRSDVPAIYEVGPDIFNLLQAEYRTDRVIEFDDAKVKRFSIRQDDTTHGFVRVEDGWAYEAEPDLPLDASKVKNLLLQIKDLRTPRYIVHVGGDPAQYGLDRPGREITVGLEDGTEFVLRVSLQTGRVGGDQGFFCGIQGRTDIFLLTKNSVKRFEVRLDDLESSQ